MAKKKQGKENKIKTPKKTKSKKKYPIELRYPISHHHVTDWDDPREYVVSHYDYDFIWIFQINKAEGIGQSFEGRPAKGLSRETRYELTNQI